MITDRHFTGEREKCLRYCIACTPHGRRSNHAVSLSGICWVWAIFYFGGRFGAKTYNKTNETKNMNFIGILGTFMSQNLSNELFWTYSDVIAEWSSHDLPKHSRLWHLIKSTSHILQGSTSLWYPNAVNQTKPAARTYPKSSLNGCSRFASSILWYDLRCHILQ